MAEAQVPAEKVNYDVALKAARDLGFTPDQNFDGGEAPELPRMKILAQAQMFEMPDGSKESTLDAILLYKHRCNVLFDESKILCQSVDAVKPISGRDVQAESCASCPKNAFGSGKGDGKACVNQIRTYWFIKGYQLPVEMMIPPTSLKAFSAYLTSLSSGVKIGEKVFALHYCQVIANLTLEKKVDGEHVWSTLKPTFKKLVDNRKTLEKMKDIREKFMEKFADEVKEEVVDAKEASTDPDPTPEPQAEEVPGAPETPKAEAPEVDVDDTDECPF